MPQRKASARRTGLAVKRKIVKVARAPRKVKATKIGPSLDPAARDWAQLIRDPCNARLTNTIWPGTAGSFVGRFESDFIIFNGATDTAGVYVFVPGGNVAYNFSAANDSTASPLFSSTATPGSSFIASAASNVRCVASCMQVSFPGTELNRAGIVSLGVAPLGTFTNNVATAAGGGNVGLTISNVRTLCQHTERTPQTMAECNWMPGPGDAKWSEVNSAAGVASILDNNSDRNAIIMSVAGLPAATGIRIRMVSVLEWTPKAAQGLVATIETPKSSNDINDVLRALPKAFGTHWFINAFKTAAPYLRAAGSVINYGSKMLGPALMAL